MMDYNAPLRPPNRPLDPSPQPPTPSTQHPPFAQATAQPPMQFPFSDPFQAHRDLFLPPSHNRQASTGHLSRAWLSSQGTFHIARARRTNIKRNVTQCAECLRRHRTIRDLYMIAPSSTVRRRYQGCVLSGTMGRRPTDLPSKLCRRGKHHCRCHRGGIGAIRLSKYADIVTGL